MLRAIAALQDNITEMVFPPELPQLLHDTGPMLGQIGMFKSHSAHGFKEDVLDPNSALEYVWSILLLFPAAVDCYITIQFS